MSQQQFVLAGTLDRFYWLRYLLFLRDSTRFRNLSTYFIFILTAIILFGFLLAL